MTKDEMTTLLRSVSCDENTVIAMGNAYELGFDQGLVATELMRSLIEEAKDICQSVDAGGDPFTGQFWDLLAKLEALQ